jgi:hypothetical protein
MAKHTFKIASAATLLSLHYGYKQLQSFPDSKVLEDTIWPNLHSKLYPML